MKLHGRITISSGNEPFVARLGDRPDIHPSIRQSEALLLEPDAVPPADREGFAALVFKTQLDDRAVDEHPPTIVLPADLEYLTCGDVIRVNPRKRELRVLYRRASKHNSFLLTERCNSNCVMCSQPPRDIDDSYIVDDLLAAIPLIHPDTESIGFTGGEPTLLGRDFIRLVRAMRDCLPSTHLHVLTNGRRFAQRSFVHELSAIGHPALTLAVPLYSDLADRHDFVVQAEGAYDETIRGLLNLARSRLTTEIRVVIHKHTYDRLPQLASFIARNLPFVGHVALMGLEMMGYVKMNLESLWIDPVDYQAQLGACVHVLTRRRIPVSIYNHQLCILDRNLWEFARKSISDWKNVYMPECEGCAARDQCGGFFASAQLRYSSHIRALAE